ncbi:uncharacterized protein LOC121836774 [Ixodes scapularis]|uniref:uncharacterized protein LOC120840378 n=1 Tax=Ixodes scapularis TaxID=6945 RepID=UPI001A9E6796|nr:uncharacterized protein LOC120840378 [Ixodes scapularis]XP_040066896.1 uncharacterized protein LOC115312146 [Ixodes scapularis]XP_040068482.1 uncharacterized protein LOC115320945 [Ixodes scapularis]XP_040068560.1 uncharacterized protein LOC120841681 [Ixodes scapularis]XP_040069790.1 uncharacterized protein LOC115314359 [Ixodes scapularis]XP_040070722.1 uncharacterized protein LOC115333052 [Ixodes scapularis]XP_040071549.1 uncharacterized protein LOC120844032 [Ixodes scapularis]XP_04007216
MDVVCAAIWRSVEQTALKTCCLLLKMATCSTRMFYGRRQGLTSQADAILESLCGATGSAQESQATAELASPDGAGTSRAKERRRQECYTVQEPWLLKENSAPLHVL